MQISTIKPLIKKRRIKTFFTVFFLMLIASLSAAPIDKYSSQLQKKLRESRQDQAITAFVYFKDKGSDSKEQLLRAKTALSAKALERRHINRGPGDEIDHRDLPVNSDYIHAVSKEATRIRHSLKWLNAVSIEATPVALERIAALPFVEKITLVNKLYRRPLPFAKTDIPQPIRSTKNNGTLALDYGNSLTQNEQINVPLVHDMGYSGSGVVIAIFDAGFNRLSHESLTPLNIGGQWDFVNDDADVGDSTDMGTGSHGTNTLSTIGGYSPGNLIGPAYGATYFLAKTENTDSELHVEEDNWCAAAEWADSNGAQIITSSLGYSTFDTGTNYSPMDMDGNTTVVTICADLAAATGIVVINSAGNENHNPTGEAKDNTLGAPADGKMVLAVGAVTSSGIQTSFSSEGPSADGRIKPDVMAMGQSVVVASSTSDTGYVSVNGTSFSCPLTAGVAALVLEANSGLTAAQVLDILRNSGDITATPNNAYGYGIIDAKKAVDAALAAASGNIAPNAAFSVQNDGGATIQFTNLSTDSDGTIASYRWDFGDGDTATTVDASHTYQTAGDYDVSLTVTDNESASETVTQTITVKTGSGGNTGGGNTGGGNGGAASSSGGGGATCWLLLGLMLIRRRLC